MQREDICCLRVGNQTPCGCNIFPQVSGADLSSAFFVSGCIRCLAKYSCSLGNKISGMCPETLRDHILIGHRCAAISVVGGGKEKPVTEMKSGIPKPIPARVFHI